MLVDTRASSKAEAVLYGTSEEGLSSENRTRMIVMTDPNLDSMGGLDLSSLRRSNDISGPCPHHLNPWKPLNAQTR